MPKRLSLRPHLTVEELEHRYRHAKDGIARSHYQILWLLAQGRTSEEVAAVTGYSRNWIYELVRSYNRLGAEALGDLRRHNPGCAPQLDDVQQANLWQVIQGPAPDGGLWNGRKVADYLSEVLGTPVSRQQGWVYLRQMELRLRVPRPEHQESSVEEQEAWKKKLHAEVERVQQDHPTAVVEIWCEDEHRIGLQPVMRRVYSEPGEAPVAQVNWNREWLWLYAFVCPQTGETYWWLLPYVNTDLFNRVLKDFAESYQLGKDKRVILPLDQAGWHTTQKLQVPDGIPLVLLPPYSPELQPAERLWTLVNEPLVNRAFASIEDVEELVYQRCQRLLRQSDLIRGLTSYHWLPIPRTA
jgi:transposase